MFGNSKYVRIFADELNKASAIQNVHSNGSFVFKRNIPLFLLDTVILTLLHLPEFEKQRFFNFKHF